MPVTTTGSEFASGLCCLAFLLLIGAGLLMLFRRRRPAAARHTPAPQPDPADPYAAMPTAELNHLASANLIEADNALRTSDQELGFAVAQYGAESTESFTAALAAARQDVAEAFRLRQQLDDDIAEDEATQRTMLKLIVQRCAQADQRLDAQADAFNKLRAMEAQVETLAQDLSTRRDAVRAALPAAQATWKTLQDKHTRTALGSVDGNVEQAGARLDFTDEQLTQAQAAITGGDRPAAALRIRAAEQALGQASALLAALASTQADLDKAATALTSLLADTQGQVAAGRAALDAAEGSGAADRMNLAASVARAEQTIADARTELAEPQTDPLTTLHRVESVAAELNSSLSGIRDAAGRTQQARALLDQVMFSARSSIESTANFVTTRRGAVGSQARTRLAEAQRLLESASATADPVAALAAAQRANDLATQAMNSARTDVEQWPGSGYGYGGSGPIIVGGSGGFGMGGGAGGAVLGGILIDSIFGGGRGRGGGMRGGGFRLGFTSEVSQLDTPQPGRFGGPSSWSR